MKEIFKHTRNEVKENQHSTILVLFGFNRCFFFVCLLRINISSTLVQMNSTVLLHFTYDIVRPVELFGSQLRQHSISSFLILVFGRLRKTISRIFFSFNYFDVSVERRLLGLHCWFTQYIRWLTLGISI